MNFFAFSPSAVPGVAGGASALAGQNDANTDYPYSTKLSGTGAGASSDFYIEITYDDILMAAEVTYAVPVKAIMGSNPDASSFVFEIEREYTFRFELSGGSTQLGTPAQTVQLTGFYIGKYELTQKQWTDVIGVWPGTAPNGINGVGDDFPAYNISHNDLAGTSVPGTSDFEYTKKGIDYYDSATN